MKIEFYPRYIFDGEALLLPESKDEGVYIADGLVEHVKPFIDRDMYLREDSKRSPEFYLVEIEEEKWKKLVRYAHSNNPEKANQILGELENQVIADAPKGYYELHGTQGIQRRLYTDQKIDF